LNCRFCQSELHETFLDLGFAPPSNSYLEAKDLSRPEHYYPLRVMVCESCWLVQTQDFANADEFFNATYAYFSSTSASWIEHAKRYCTDITARLGLGPKSFVIEVASNDGYLLRNFVAAGVPCLGIEPTASTAAAAEAQGVTTLREFFGEALGRQLASEGRKADLIIGNNVFAHVPDINDFTRGLAAVLKEDGVVTLEFPHLLNLIRLCQFDTVYHEHFSYLSLAVVQKIFAKAGLRIFDVEELSTHGGSLRVYGCLMAAQHTQTPSVEKIILQERDAGLESRDVFSAFQAKANTIKDVLLSFLIEAKRKGQKVVGYGAAAKGNTLLNFAGVKPDLLAFVCDAAPSKQGKFMPGSHIPIVAPEALKAAEADFVLILPWNIASEVMEKTESLVLTKARYVVAVPELTIL
jgi:SAM-dependent methyltransferase